MPFIIRPATVADAPIIASHRTRMFADMGTLPPELHGDLFEASRQWLETALGTGEYVGWLAADEAQPTVLVAGVGAQRRRVQPHAVVHSDGSHAVGQGRHALVVNVFTEPAWRRRGIAELLMRRLLAWAREERLDRVVLHASAEGRPLYERLGFVPTNEMRLAEDLDGPAPR